jgi:hypothetical protein
MSLGAGISNLSWLTLAFTGSNRQYRRPLYVAALHIPQAAIRIGQSVGRRSRLNVGLDGLGQERADVFARIRGHAKQFTFLVEMPAIVKARHVAEMYASDGANPAAIERFQCRRDELAGRREEHRSIRLAGHVTKIGPRPCRA